MSETVKGGELMAGIAAQNAHDAEERERKRQQEEADCEEAFITSGLAALGTGDYASASRAYFKALVNAGISRKTARTKVDVWLERLLQTKPGKFTTGRVRDILEDVFQNVPDKPSAPDKPGNVFRVRTDATVPGIYHGITFDMIELGEFVCGLVTPVSWVRNTSNEEWHLLLKFKDRQNIEHEFILRAGALDTPGQPWLSEIQAAGLQIANPMLARDYFRTLNTNVYQRLVSEVGWTEDRDAFMLPAGPIPEAGDGETYVYRRKSKATCAYFGTAGTLEDWQQNVGSLCRGNSRLMFGVSCAFAAPLLALLDITEGFGFHLWGKSSTGKTTCTEVAGSVCGGGGPLGYSQDWIGTPKSIEQKAVQHNDCLLVMDEISKMDERRAAQVAYMLAGGTGASRLTQTGDMREILHWLTIVLSTGEVSLEDYLKSADPDARLMGGQEVRLINFPSDAGAGIGAFERTHGAEPAKFSTMLKDNAKKYYGTALVEWLTILTGPDREKILTRAAQIIEEFVTECAKDATEQVARVARSFAVICAAGELASEYGITTWEEGNAFAAAAKCFDDWRAERGTDGSGDEARALKWLRSYFQKHRADFEDPEESSPESGDGYAAPKKLRPRVPVHRVGWVTDAGEYCVYPEAFESRCQEAKFPLKLVIEVAHKAGLLATEGRNLKVKRYDPAGNRMRVYAFGATVVGDDSEDDWDSVWAAHRGKTADEVAA